jgi:hypothetical protein
MEYVDAKDKKKIEDKYSNEDKEYKLLLQNIKYIFNEYNLKNKEDYTIESNHKHSFSYYDYANKKCNVCLQEIVNRSCYECNCKIVLCLDCGSKILFEDNKNTFHNHTLKLTYRKIWTCDICNSSYINTCSFFCRLCDFDVCKSCFFQEKKEKLNPVKINDYLKNKNEQKKPLIIEDNSQKKNGQLISMDLHNNSIHNHPLYFKEKLLTQCLFCGEYITNAPGYECDFCEIILCLDCADEIYRTKNIKNIHNNDEHTLYLEFLQRGYIEYICNMCQGHFSNISLHCRECNYDVCFNCFRNHC